jgi:hypothetical protein
MVKKFPQYLFQFFHLLSSKQDAVSLDKTQLNGGQPVLLPGWSLCQNRIEKLHNALAGGGKRDLNTERLRRIKELEHRI